MRQFRNISIQKKMLYSMLAFTLIPIILVATVATTITYKTMRDQLIYDQDTAWLRECDMVVAECTCPSLGVGYELAYAEKLGKPCHIFYDRSKTQLSAMLTGDPYFNIHPYESEEEIYETLSRIL